jgi:hypothetical protein
MFRSLPLLLSLAAPLKTLAAVKELWWNITYVESQQILFSSPPRGLEVELMVLIFRREP